MREQDSLQRFLIENKDIRGEIVHLKESLSEAFNNKDYPASLKILLGQCLCATTLMSATIKFEGKISLQLRGEGVVRLILVQVTDDRVLRGIIKWEGDTDGKSFRELIGDARLAITVEPKLGQHYQGLVPLEEERLDACLEAYFLQSEQLPTQIWLAADANNAAGFFLQKLPLSGEESRPEEWEHISILARSITDDELLTLSNETVLYRLFHQESVRVFEKQAVTYRCGCSQKRSENAIVALGLEEIDDIIAEGKPLHISCEFCGNQYRIELEDIRQIKARLEASGN